jgi:hypothetical protein
MSIKAAVDGNILEIQMKGLSILWTLKKALSFPLKNVVGATYDPNAVSLPKGIRSPGLHIPKIMTAGTYFQNGERQFWHVSSGKNTLVIRLKNEKYSQLVIEVTNPKELVSEINSLL